MWYRNMYVGRYLLILLNLMSHLFWQLALNYRFYLIYIIIIIIIIVDSIKEVTTGRGYCHRQSVIYTTLPWKSYLLLSGTNLQLIREKNQLGFKPAPHCFYTSRAFYHYNTDPPARLAWILWRNYFNTLKKLLEYFEDITIKPKVPLLDQALLLRVYPLSFKKKVNKRIEVVGWREGGDSLFNFHE